MGSGFTKFPQEGIANGGMNFAPNGLAAYGGLAEKATPYNQAGLAGQQDALAMWKKNAMGQGGPSAAEIAARNQGEANARAAMSVAARGRGGNLAGMQQQAMGGLAGANAQLTQNLATVRAQEQLAAQQAYAQQAAQMSQMGLGYDQLAAQTLLGGQGLQQDWQLGNRQLDIQQQANNREFWGGIAQAGIGAFGQVMGGMSQMSDQRVKTDIQPSAGSASDALRGGDNVYRYKRGEGLPGGLRAGPMAQGLEQSPLGASIVSEGPRGKAVDIGGLATLTAASQAEQIGRMDRLEQAILGQRGAGYGPGAPMSGRGTPPTRERDVTGNRPSIDAQLLAEEDAYRRRQARLAELERGASSDPLGYSGSLSRPSGPSPVAFGTVGARMPPGRLTAIDPWEGR